MRRVFLTALSLAWASLPILARTWVAVIGVGDYTGSAFTNPVSFAENDARNFGIFAAQRALDPSTQAQKPLDPSPLVLTSPPIPYQLLSNGKQMQSKVASWSNVENELTGLFARAQRQDTIYLFISARGIARPGLDGFIGTADTVGEKPASGSVPLRFLKQLIEGSDASRVIIFADVARKPADVLANNINRRLAELGDNTKVAGVLATQPGQVSEERSNPTPGQGFFGYYLVKSGGAGSSVSAISTAVRTALDTDATTKGKQRPAEFGLAMAKMGPLWRASAGPILGEQQANPPISPQPPLLLASIFRPPGLLAFQAPAADGPQAAVRAELENPGPVTDSEALAKKVQDLNGQIPADEWEQLRTLAIEKLAGDGQRVVDRYGMQNLLPDDPLRLKPEDFKTASDQFKAALQLLALGSRASQPERILNDAFREQLNVRQQLCLSLSGAANALGTLESASASIAVIPEVWNAIGIYHLDSASQNRGVSQNRARAMHEYSEAIRAFREAKRLSPGWMYPRHNLALALIEQGEYAAAEREYREAIASQPLEPYVYYNLGLLYHRMNRKSEAKSAYEEALKAYNNTAKELGTRAADWQARWPDDAALARQRVDVYNTNSADVLNAWGILLAPKRDLEARVKYYSALRINPDLCAARDNWAQFEQSVEEHRDKNAVSKGALSLLNTNLSRPGCTAFHPSWLQRAKLRRKSGDVAGALGDFAEVHRLVPSNTEALTGMALVDAADGKYGSAIQSLNEAVAIEAAGGAVYPDVYAQMAEVYRQANNPAACRDAFDKAIAASRGAVYAVSARELRNRSARCNQPGKP